MKHEWIEKCLETVGVFALVVIVMIAIGVARKALPDNAQGAVDVAEYGLLGPLPRAALHDALETAAQEEKTK